MFEQPEHQFTYADGVMIVRIELDVGQAGIQHVHDYSHALIVAGGALRIVAGGEEQQLSAPAATVIPANVLHILWGLAPHTVVYCVHKDESHVPI